MTDEANLEKANLEKANLDGLIRNLTPETPVTEVEQALYTCYKHFNMSFQERIQVALSGLPPEEQTELLLGALREIHANAAE